LLVGKRSNFSAEKSFYLGKITDSIIPVARPPSACPAWRAGKQLAVLMYTRSVRDFAVFLPFDIIIKKAAHRAVMSAVSETSSGRLSAENDALLLGVSLHISKKIL